MTLPQITMIGLLILECISHVLRLSNSSDNLSDVQIVFGAIIRMGAIIGVLSWGGFWV